MKQIYARNPPSITTRNASNPNLRAKAADNPTDCCVLVYQQVHRAPTDRGVIRRGDRQAHQREDRYQKALGLSQRQLERRAQHQAGLDGRAGIPSLPAGSDGLPAFQRCVLDPQGEAAPSAQARLVGWPVPYLERHLRDVVAAVGIVFMGHWAIRTRKG